MTRLAGETQDYYLVGFSPSAAATARAGRYRASRCACAGPAPRHARDGYAVAAAVADPPHGDRLRARRALLAAGAARRLHDLRDALGEPDGRARDPLARSDLPLRDGTNGMADVVFVVRDMRDGRGRRERHRHDAAAVDGRRRRSTGIGTYRVHFEVPPGSYMMRTVVREPGGLVGSADRKLDVRGFSGPDVTVSDVILGRPAERCRCARAPTRQDGLSGHARSVRPDADQLRDVAVTASLVPTDSVEPARDVRAESARRSARAPASCGARRSRSPLRRRARRVSRARDGHRRRRNRRRLTREVDVVAGTAPPPPPPPAPDLRPRDVLESDFVRPTRAALRASHAAGAAEAVKGFDLFERADYPAAAAELAAALRGREGLAPLAFVLGWAYEGAGDHTHAIGSWRAAATIDPKLLPRTSRSPRPTSGSPSPRSPRRRCKAGLPRCRFAGASGEARTTPEALNMLITTAALAIAIQVGAPSKAATIELKGEPTRSRGRPTARSSRSRPRSATTRA
jgi:hypothetical protein